MMLEENVDHNVQLGAVPICRLPDQTVPDPLPTLPRRTTVSRSFSAWLPHVVWSWMVALFLGSMLPWAVKARLHTLATSHRPGELDFHRILHVCSFAITTLLLGLLAKTTRHRLSVVGFTVLVAFAIEYLESLIFGNPFEWHDVRDDAFGVLISILAFLLLRAKGSAQPGS